MVLQSQSGIERIQEQFDELCRNILAEELTDNGRCLRRKGLSTMKLSLSPMETRHETAIRVIVAQLGCLGMRLKRLEEQLNPAATPVDPAEAREKDVPATSMIGAPSGPGASLAESIDKEIVEKFNEKPLTEE